jgi:hypothetical protein
MKSIILLIVAVAAASIMFLQCTNQVDLDTRRQELIDYNERMRTAHLEGDYETILDAMAYPYTKVRNGEVARPTEQENTERYTQYMTTMNVTVWDDLEDPNITLSDDGSLATVIYRKRLVMEEINPVDAAAPFEGVFAWQSTYRYTDDGWKMIADVTTSLPRD